MITDYPAMGDVPRRKKRSALLVFLQEVGVGVGRLFFRKKPPSTTRKAMVEDKVPAEKRPLRREHDDPPH